MTDSKKERSLFPRFRHPFSLLESMDDDWDLHEFSSPSGLAVSEDENHVIVEASVPGVAPKDVDLSFDKGVLWIKAEKKEEDKRRKFYRKALSAFSYRILVPGEIDESQEPDATCSRGVLIVTFAKKRKGTTRKIPIREVE